MVDYEGFKTKIKEVASEFRKEKDTIRLISHLDADGLSSAGILINAFNRENKNFVVSIIKQLSDSFIDQLAFEDYKVIVFTDLGSGNLKKLKEKLKDKRIYVLDHHQIDEKEDLFLVNPLEFELDEDEISGAGVTYLFAKELNKENIEDAYLGIVGAIGDIQNKEGLKGINLEILEDAKNKVEIKMGLRLFGAQTRPLHKALMYSTDPYIPGISGNENAAFKLLDNIGIKIRDPNGKFRKLVNLKEEELEKLATAIIMKRVNEDNPEDVFGDIYLLKNENDESPIKDLREFSTMLNACGRLNKASTGIGVCIGSEKLKKESYEVLHDYKIEIINGLNWFNNNRGKDKIIEGEGYAIINTEDNIKDTLVGTVLSIVSKSGIFKPNTILIGTGYTLEGDVKISIRISGYKHQEINLKELLDEIVSTVGGSAGGHNFAAGSLISQDKEEEFVKNAVEILNKKVMEEIIK